MSALNDQDEIAVERAIAELRAGRALILKAAGASFAFQGLESAQLAAPPHARLLLSAARLRYLGRAAREAAAHDVSAPSPHHLRQLATARSLDPASLPASLPLMPGEAEALLLAKLALIIPALLVFPVSALARPDLALTVEPAAIAAYRAQQTRDLAIVSRAPVPLEGGQSEFVVFRGGEGLRDQVAIVIGQPDLASTVTVRLHSACLTGDLFGSLKCDCGDQLRDTAKAMAAGQGGIILYLDQEGRGTGIANKMRAYALQAEGLDTFDADEVLGFEHDERHFDFAARMLQLLGVRAVRIMTNNPAKVAALRAAGLTVTDMLAIQGRQTPQNRFYLETKRDRGGHRLEVAEDATGVNAAKNP